MADLVGKKLKDFSVLRRLGRGAMAEVYLAQQVSLGRHVALKVLNADLAQDPNYVRRFHHEARAAAALVHGGIVQIYEVGQDDSIHFIAQEYVAGHNLGELIRSRGSLTPGLTLDILRQVVGALHKAASQGIVHRDLKPENIMLARTGEVKVTDFGLARVQGGAANLTQVGITMGTPLYMSPEQIEGRELDSRSDIYSLGVTAYHMLAGEPPFNGDTPLSVAMQHLNQPAVPLTSRRQDISPRLAHVVERMIAKKLSDRFSDPAALAGELHALATEAVRDGWATTTDDWSLARMIQAADGRVDATSQLDQLMKVAHEARPANNWKRAAAAIVGCAVLGGGLAYATRPPSLLRGAYDGVPPQEDAWQQIYHAKMVETPAAWEAAISYPNANDFQINLARQGLVYNSLTRTQDYAKAIEQLQLLANWGPKDQLYRVFGNAGLVVAYVGEEDYQSAFNANAQITADDRTTLRERSPRMFELLNAAIEELMNWSP